MKWMRLFRKMFRSPKPKATLLGFSIREKDAISVKYRWVTCNARGMDRFVYEPGEALILSPNDLKPTTIIRMYKNES